jgi:tetratricopeptide (TPR) repeat protein
MLETVREYAGEQLHASGEMDTVRRLYAAYFLELAEEADHQLRGPDLGRWQARLEQEHQNLRAALTWSLGKSEDERALRIAGALWYFWTTHGHLSEGQHYLDRALAQAAIKEGLNPGGGTSAGHDDTGGLPSDSGGHRRAWARAVHGAAILARHQGDLRAARSLSENALAIARGIEDGWLIAWSLINLGHVERIEGNFVASRSLLEESLVNYQQVGSKWGICAVLANLGFLAIAQGDYRTARSYQEEALAIGREVGDRYGIALGLLSLGDVARLQGDVEGAIASYRESLVIYRGLENRRGMAYCLEGLGRLAGPRGNRAPRLFGAAQVLREAVGASLTETERVEYERDLAAARATRGEDAFAAAWMEGQAMSLAEVVAYALEEGFASSGP